MIPRDFVTEWRAEAPWIADHQVEQDLLLSRALVALFTDATIADHLAFRGGTALNKLFLRPPARYSEDIDLVQTRAGAAGRWLDAIHRVLDPWLGSPQWKQTDGRVTLAYRAQSEEPTPRVLRLKVEINTRDHALPRTTTRLPFRVDSRWFDGGADVVTFPLDELIGTKLRALYQRRKGRDLFDLALVLQRRLIDPARVVASFQEHMRAANQPVTRAMFEQNLASKRQHPLFAADLTPLLAPGHTWDLSASFALVEQELLRRLPGDPWKGARQPDPRT